MTETTRTTRHAGIDSDAILDAALRLIESDGATGLTMRKLAAELGVTATSIYWHIGGRDEVVATLIERQGERLAARPIVGDTPAERLFSATKNVWDTALAHPEIMRLAHSIGATSALEMHLEIALARELTAAGIVGDDGRDALRALLICVGGFLVLGLRPSGAVPTELASTTLWAAVDDSDVHPSTIAALSSPVDLESLLARTLRAVIADLLPA